MAKDLIEAIKAHHVFVDPTLTVFRNMILLADLPEYYQPPDNAFMPEPLKKYWLKYRDERMKTVLSPETLGLRNREFQKYKELTGILYRAGVTLLAGTDTPEPFCPLVRQDFHYTRNSKCWWNPDYPRLRRCKRRRFTMRGFCMRKKI